MKHLFTFLILLCFVVSGKSQWWFDAGVKGSYGPTFMYDKSVFDSGSYKHKLTAGHNYGFRMGFNHGHHIGLNLEYNLGHSKQDFNVDGDVFNKFDVQHNDIVGTFRYSGNGAFIEVGAEYASIKDVSLENFSTPEAPVEIDATSNFEKSYLGGVLGFGTFLAGSELLTINLGIRLHWGFDDIVNATGKLNNYPIYGYPEPIDPSNKTIQTAAQLQLEVNYAFGRFAKSSCSERWHLILFN